MKRTLAALASALLLAGCSSAPATPAASTTPTPSAATTQQFASIISGHEADWREVIDKAGACRFLWVESGGSPADKANAMSCYARETTIVMTAGTAAKDIRELTPSSEVQELVSDTLSALDAISEVDLEGVCGEPFSDGSPSDSKKCSQTQGGLYQAYSRLKTVLDEWKPYI